MKLSLQRFDFQQFLPTPLTNFFQRPVVKILGQVAIIGLVWGGAVVIKKMINIPFSSGVLGLFLMLTLLFTHIVKYEWVNVGAKFILGELVLLFIPLMMSITEYKQLFFAQGWQLVLTIVISTALVMLSSAVTFMLGNRIKRAVYRKRHTHENLKLTQEK